MNDLIYLVFQIVRSEKVSVKDTMERDVKVVERLGLYMFYVTSNKN
jgi:hypothetical protein